ncbi:MAG: hypothetical protein R3E98_12870 [Gemmatimonadota bacterium]
MSDRSGASIGAAATRAPARRARGVLAAVLLAACAPATYGGTTAVPDLWLEDTGFPERAHWPGVLFHRARTDIPPRPGLDRLLDEQPALEVRPVGVADLGVWLVQGGTSCPLTVYLNGERLMQRGDRKPLGTLVPLASLDALEAYAGSDGPALAPDGCGVLLLWAERRSRPERAFRGAVDGRLTGNGASRVDAVRLTQVGSLPVPVTDGRFHLPGLRPGRYRVEVLEDGRVLLSQPVRVWAHQTAEVAIDVETRPSRDRAVRR